MAAALFLEVNGLIFSASEESTVYTRSLAAGEIDAGEYADWLKRACA
ncbi:MAG: hypothetical protein PWQ29_1576 [Verrucomicrobiota bacterium]|jgi:prophage maintenance system killer protein|nr:hypothetical protein [Verrucomicrobiota bacterium]